MELLIKKMCSLDAVLSDLTLSTILIKKEVLFGEIFLRTSSLEQKISFYENHPFAMVGSYRK